MVAKKERFGCHSFFTGWLQRNYFNPIVSGGGVEALAILSQRSALNSLTRIIRQSGLENFVFERSA